MNDQIFKDRTKELALTVINLTEAIVEEEADESMYWLELLRDSRFISEELITEIMKEANGITAMTGASIKTLRMRR